MNGDEVRPYTKEVIKRVETPYVPTPSQIEGLTQKRDTSDPKSETNALGEALSKRVEEKIAAAVETAIGKIDIEAIVAKALEQALK